MTIVIREGNELGSLEGGMNSVRLSTTLLALIFISAPSHAGPPQKGEWSGGMDCRDHEHHCKHKHCEHCDAPFAAILGSAPAMLAPIVLVRTDTKALPNEKEPEKDHLEQLKELLAILDDLTPADTRDTTSNPPQQSAAAPSEALSSRLKNLETSLEGSVQRMEAAVDILVKMKGQIETIQQRLDKIDKPAP